MIVGLGLSLVAHTAYANSADSCGVITPRLPGADVIGLTAKFGQHGLLYSKDGGKTFTQLCKAFAAMPSVDSFGDPTTLTPGFEISTLVSHDGRLMVGDLDGLWIDDGSGCNWRLAPELRKVSVKALTFDPRDPKVIYGITATANADNGVFRLNAEGEIERLGLQEPIMFYDLHVVPLPNGGTRFYSLGVREQVQAIIEPDGTTTILPPADGGAHVDDAGRPLINIVWVPRYVIRYSDDFGDSWTAHDIGLLPSYDTSLEAIDPTNPDRVIVSRSLDSRMFGSPFTVDQVLVSDDRGETFREWLEVASIAGVSFQRNGTVFIADRGEGLQGDPQGLWRADSAGDDPELIADYDTWCVEAREDRLEVCQRYDWGVADPQTGAFTKLTSFFDLSTLHSCDGFDSVATCSQELCSSHCLHWADIPLCAEHYPECATENLGNVESGTPDASANASKKIGGCGCSTLGALRLDSDAPFLDIFWMSFVLMCSARLAPFTQGARRKKAKSAGTR
jgi:hypothetical protein